MAKKTQNKKISKPRITKKKRAPKKTASTTKVYIVEKPIIWTIPKPMKSMSIAERVSNKCKNILFLCSVRFLTLRETFLRWIKR